MTKNADVIDIVPSDRKGPDHEARVRILVALQTHFEDAISAGQAISGLPLSEMVLLILTPGMEKKVPFPMPPPMVVLGTGAKEKEDGAKEDAPNIYILAEPRKGFGKLLKSIYSNADARSTSPYDNPLPEGYVFVVLGTPSGYSCAVFGKYESSVAPKPSGASN